MPSVSPALTAFTFGSEASAKAAVAALDAAAGLPLASKSDGSGRHAHPLPCTATSAQILQHPTQSKWALAIPASQESGITQTLAKAGIVPPAAAALDATWSGFSTVWPLPADIAAAQTAVATPSKARAST